MVARSDRAGLSVDNRLASFIEDRALPGTAVSAPHFWQGLASLVAEFSAPNQALLLQRQEMQAAIDAWHIAQRGKDHDPAGYRTLLDSIGYIVPEGPDFQIETAGVDPEIALIPGPQLVVPSLNARFALNAANARWGSLYDALYGTDAMGDLPSGPSDAARAARVVGWARRFLDQAVPLQHGSWTEVRAISVRDQQAHLTLPQGESGLRRGEQFAGFAGIPAQPSRIVLINNGLHIDCRIDPASQTGARDPAGLADIWLEAAVSAIVDLEDSVAAVDAGDKVAGYETWLGLMRGDLQERFDKNGTSILRRLVGDLDLLGPDGQHLSLKGRALLLVRNVGHLMTTPAVLDRLGQEMPEGLLDAMVTTLCGLHDLAKTKGPRNSVCGSIYVVKPKMHGPEEVAFADQVFGRVEEILGLPRYSVKLGIMDEERRTSVNLKACIRAAKNRLAFINTGFLDRTGDEIHTSMEAGPMVRKGEMKAAAWITAYERRNVDIGLACGLPGRAQIGKGMWAMPDRMADMLASKQAHPEAGANCAWVPSPVAATLHATHYHRVHVLERQREIAAGGARSSLDQLLTLPLAKSNWSEADIGAEIENNVQGILGYVVRWVDQGIGCSKVPDIHDIGLMEDRATCRISSQALANWLHHGVIARPQVEAALRKMARIVDRQNAGDPAYQPMAPDFDGPAFLASCDLIFKGAKQPSGYTEPLLHGWRLQVKAAAGRAAR